MFAYDDEAGDLPESETNYYTFQEEEYLAFPKSKPVESLSFQNQNKNDGGLPNYFGDNPAPIEINGKRKPKSKS
jgi:hypothetical protein